MPNRTARLRVGFLTTLVIVSIIAAGIAFSGGAAAATNQELSADQTAIGAGSTTTTINASASLDATADATVVNITNSDFVLDSVSAGDVTFGNSSTERDAESVDARRDTLNITLRSDLNISTGETVYVVIDNVENPPVDTAGLPGDLSRGVTVRFADSGNTVIDEAFDTSFEFTLKSGRFDWNRDAGTGNVTDGATLYQGERGISIYAPDGNAVSPSSLERTGGASEGEPLGLPIPADQPLGSYSDGSETEITVQTARITTFDVNNNNGADVNGGTLMPSQDQSEVAVAYNFGEAERLELIIEDDDGVDVTNELLADGESRYLATDSGEGTIGISPGAVDRGEYTFTVEGEDDLDFGEATRSTTITISSTTADDSSGQDETDGDETDGDETDGDETDGDDSDSDGGGTDDGGIADNDTTDGDDDGMTDDDTETDSGEQDDGEDGTTDDSEDEPAGGGSDADSGTTGDDETEDQPGFGVFVTAVALLGVVLVAVRQTNR